MTIRLGTTFDIPKLLELGGAFYSRTAWSNFAEFDPHSLAITLSELCKNGRLLVSDGSDGIDGMLGFVVAPLYANLKVTFAQEVFLISVRPGVGRDLIAEYEMSARRHGASIVITAAEVGLRDGAVSRVYGSLGYSETERVFMKGLI